jgi:hypothetical protein
VRVVPCAAASIEEAKRLHWQGLSLREPINAIASPEFANELFGLSEISPIEPYANYRPHRFLSLVQVSEVSIADRLPRQL